MSKLLQNRKSLRPANLAPLETAVLSLYQPKAPELAEQAATELERLQAIEAAFFKIVSPDGFHQCGFHEECPECEQEGQHAAGCKLAAALDAKS
jgi:hypothetical protein